MANAFDQFDTAPQTGPVYGAGPDPFKVRDQQLQEESARRAAEANARAAQADARSAQTNQRSQLEFNATHNPDGSPKPAPKAPNQIPPGAATGIQENMNALAKLDQAIASLKTRPQSIGPGTGMLGDTFTQFNDPEGNDARQKVGEVGAVKIHDLSGAAVSASEAPRFSAFVPKVSDTPEKALTNLENFRNNLRKQIKEQLDYYGTGNGYLPYQTPQAEAFLKSLDENPDAGVTTGEVGSDQRKRLSADQQQVFFGILETKGPQEADAYLKQFGLSLADPSDAKKPHSNQIDYSAIDARTQQGIEQRIQESGNTAAGAFQVGAKDSLTVGAAPRIAAFGDAVQGSLSGQGSFNDLYDMNLAVNRGYIDALQGDHPYAYLGGEVAGGLALPAFGARTPLQLSRVGAGYGFAHGFNTSDGTVGEKLTRGADEGIVGAGLGYALPKAFGLIPQRSAKDIPPLVDSSSGRLNEPLEALRPGDRVAQAQQLGIDLPMGSATDRGGAIIEKGLDNLPGSAGVMNDARRTTEGQVQGAADKIADSFGSSRTLNEGGAELQRGAQERIERGKSVIGKAYDAIPISSSAPTNLNNTKTTLEQLAGKLESNPGLQQEIRDPTLLKYLDAINKNGLNWQDLKDFRTFIGNKIGQFRFSEDARTGDYRSLYAALSEDMRNSAAAQGPGALRAFERANTLNRQNEQMIEGALSRILGNNGQMAPEKAAMAVQAMTKGGKATGDLKTLAQVRAATVKSGAWDEIASTLIRIGGQPANSPGRAFDPKVFVQWYSDMAEPARAMLFKPELRKTLDQFVAVNQRLSGSNALRNTSQTVPNMTGTLFAGGAGAAVATGNIPALLMIGGEAVANFGMAKLWTNPGFVKWATGYSRAVASGSDNAARSQVGRLSKLATTNPELREPISGLLQAMNDNVTPRLAASQPGNENDD